jgi:hypothetical protein
MIKGSLFTRYFLETGICETAAYKSITEADLGNFINFSSARWSKLATMSPINESETEREFIFPLLDQLGWHYLPHQKTAKDGKDVPDALLFLSDEIKTRAQSRPTIERYKLGTIVVENEARDTKLGSGTEGKETPSGQILRYLSRADIASSGTLRWGLLTNGHLWRLYDHRALSRAEGFVEFDLPALLTQDLLDDKTHWLRVFLLTFSATSFIPDGASNTSLIQFILAEGKNYEQRITAALSTIVFNEVYPGLITAIGATASPVQTADAAWRAAARQFALKLLFRLLFLLYAEDRDLLPMKHDGYLRYSLRNLRDEAAKVVDGQLALSTKQISYWQDLSILFKAIAEGDDDMGLPPYNGGLFEDDPAAAFPALPDAALAPLIDKISREGPPGARRRINYRDLSVQQLGSIYEQLLEQDVIAGPGGLALRPNAFSRKTTGSYYTPDELVQLILRRAIGPLLEERKDAFKAKIGELAKAKTPKAERLKTLARVDAAAAFIELRIIDPAMGSGHFLVSLVDYLADQVLDALADAPGLVTWADDSAPYRSPLADQLLQLRQVLLARATAARWPVRDDQLDDRHLIRRIILKRVIYGVDLNPMAVELAKLSLWLHSFTVGAPLSFLDHHLRVGDSLFGEFVAPVQAELRESYGFVMTDAVTKAANAAAGMAMVEALSDADITEVKQSADGFAGVEDATAELRAFLNLYQAKRWYPGSTLAETLAIDTIFGGGFGDPIAIAAGASIKAPKDSAGFKKGKQVTTAAAIFKAANAFLAAGGTLSAERHFLHWEAAFPGVWDKWETTAPTGGFDAVIGNPPWDRMKLQEVEWFAARKPEIALLQRASDRKKAITKLRNSKDALAADYAAAEAAAEGAARVARSSGAYPLLSGGDINIYSLFVERAARLVTPDGIVGLLVPSGIAADLGAAKFFRSISTTGRLAALLDFENGKRKPEPFFPDVHRSFKFSAIIFGGAQRVFPQSFCAFFQQSGEAAEANAFPLTPADFAAVNPNTGTAPVFRTQRDADITRAIYARLPVLVNRSGAMPVFTWPVRYMTMFHMTNDSDKFLTAAELEKSGAYKVQGGTYEKGAEKYLPLYEGKMVQAYDHRAASIVVNPENVKRPAQPEETTPAQHADPSWLPTPQFLVSGGLLTDIPRSWTLGIKHISAATNMRTMISAIIPKSGAGNSLPILESEVDFENEYERFITAILANLNCLAFDFVLRQKLHGNNLNWFVLEQLPVVPPQKYAQKFGAKTGEKIVQDDVLRLTYVSHDMAGFAVSQGYTGPPFAWDEEDRLRRRARLDALFFHLYGIGPEDIKYILSTFPIVIREEVEKYGSFRSEKLILGYYNALAAGHPDAAVAG